MSKSDSTWEHLQTHDEVTIRLVDEDCLLEAYSRLLNLDSKRR